MDANIAPEASQTKTIMKLLRFGAGALLTVCLFGAATINLESTPPIWWDEGWNLSVARNWIEKGHYGRLLDGNTIAPGLATGFPAVAPVAISFKFLGIGIWQGRVVGLIFTLGAFILIYFFAQRLYNRNIAVATLAVLVFMTPKAYLHPILIGRQVLGEMPMLFYLLSGYFFLLLALQSSIWFIFGAIPLWALALTTKLQPVPFWFLSLLLPLCLSIYYKHWNVAGLLSGAAIGSMLVAAALNWGLPIILFNRDLPLTTVSGLYSVTAWVDLPLIRRIAVLAELIYVLPVVLGLYYAMRHPRVKVGLLTSLAPPDLVRCALWALSASWLAWYAFFSSGSDRYLFPAVFIGSIFVPALLNDLTNHFNWSSTLLQAGRSLTRLRFDREGRGALLAIVLITFGITSTGKMFYQLYVVEPDQSVLEIAEFFNTQTAADAIIETYDSELMFLLNRRYHYPPDQIHVDLIHRTLLGEDIPIRYDPLAADPDYLVVGFFSKLWQLYDSVLYSGDFRLLRAYNRYSVFQRVR
jgi:hypothetical protein